MSKQWKKIIKQKVIEQSTAQSKMTIMDGILVVTKK